MDTAPDTVDADTPNPARMYDYYLGGHCNFSPDRELARQVIEAVPEVPMLARANKAFLRRATQFCARQGIRQFLDIGCGITGVGSTHEVVTAIAPDAKVAYADSEPVAVAHSELLLQDNENALIVPADFREPEAIVRHRAIRELLDFSQPVAVVLGLVLPWMSDDDHPGNLISRCMRQLAPGSYLVLSQATTENIPPEVIKNIVALYQRSAVPVVFRDKAELAEWLEGAGLVPVEPGIEWVPLWHPENPADVGEHPERSMLYGVVSQLPVTVG